MERCERAKEDGKLNGSRHGAAMLYSGYDHSADFIGESESLSNAERNDPADSDVIQGLRALTARLKVMTGE